MGGGVGVYYDLGESGKGVKIFVGVNIILGSQTNSQKLYGFKELLKMVEAVLAVIVRVGHFRGCCC